MIEPKENSAPDNFEEVKLDQIKIKDQNPEIEAIENLIEPDMQDEDSFYVSDGEDEDKHIPFHADEEVKIQ